MKKAEDFKDSFPGQEMNNDKFDPTKWDANGLTEEAEEEVDMIFEEFEADGDKNKLYKNLEVYRDPYGYYEGYVRMNFDVMINSNLL